MKTMIALATTLIGLAAAPALADETQCFQNDQFLVIGHEVTDEMGTTFLVRPPARGKIACVYQQQPGDVVIGAPGEPLWYEGLTGQYLVLTRSTGPQSDLLVYDLTADLYPPLIDVQALDDIAITDQTITYWQHLLTGTAVNCPDFAENTANGMLSMIYEERVLDLATVTVAATGNTRCVATQ